MSAQVIHLAVPMAEADYRRPPLRWITRRARTLQRGFGISRRVAIYHAALDYDSFQGLHRERLLRLILRGHGPVPAAAWPPVSIPPIPPTP